MVKKLGGMYRNIRVVNGNTSVIVRQGKGGKYQCHRQGCRSDSSRCNEGKKDLRVEWMGDDSR